MSEIERSLIGEEDNYEDFRRSVIGTIGARSLDFGDTPAYSEIFYSYIERLKEAFFAERKDELQNINENFLKYTSDEAGQLDAKETEQVEAMLNRLVTQYGYCKDCARDTVGYLVRHRYCN